MEIQNHRIRIQKPELQKDLTIIYKESPDDFHEIQVCSDSFLRSLRYFQKKSSEINQTHLIYIKENVPFGLFESFILSTETNEIDINDKNFDKFYYLSCKYEYEELKKEIENFIDTRPDVQFVLNQFIEKNFEIEPEKEELIAKNIDIAIKTGILNQIPLEIIIRILNSPKKVVKDHHLMFKFVISLLKNFSKSEENFECISFLTSSLDYCKMTNEEIEELFKAADRNIMFSPQNADEKILLFIDEEKKMKNKIVELEKKISQCDENFNKKIECLEQKLERSQNHYDEVIKELIEKRIGKIEEFQKEKLNENFFSKQSELILKDEQLKEEIAKTQKTVKCLEQKLEKSNKYYDNVIKELIEKRISKIEEFQKEKLNEKLFFNRNERIAKNEQIKKEINNNVQTETFVPGSDQSFDGIINYLEIKTGGNIHDNGTIEVTSNSILESGCHPKKLLQSSDDYYATKRGDKNAWVCFDFKNMEIEITDYRIKRGPSCNIKNWIFEISNDGNNWTTIDQHFNCDDLEIKTSIKTFKVQKNHFSRFCRIRHCGEFCNYLSRNTMETSRIEFYGKLKKPKAS